MCDDITDGTAKTARSSGGTLNRREFAAFGASMALAGCSGPLAAQGGPSVREKTVSITTADGVCDAFFVHPAKGAHPGIIMWPDIAGLREVKKIMARGLASQGYAVLVVNQYYRSGPAPVMRSFSEYRTPEGQARIAPMRALLAPDAIMRDAKAFVGFLDGQEAVDKARGIGSNGYCMGGPFAMRTAAAVSSRVGAAASLHGAGLVTQEPDSPHRLLANTKAGYFIGIARNDDAKQPQAKEDMRKAAEAAGRPLDQEVFEADHGWCVPDSPAYDPLQADRAWQKMLALFSKL